MNRTKNSITFQLKEVLFFRTPCIIMIHDESDNIKSDSQIWQVWSVLMS